jgi:hypothetical protein
MSNFASEEFKYLYYLCKKKFYDSMLDLRIHL